MKQYEAVIQIIEQLGGIATLNQINQNVFKIKDCVWNTKTPFASVRRIVQQTEEIYKIRPGLYALESYRRYLENNGIYPENCKNKDSKEVRDFNHTYYQGLLIEMGNLRNLDTFVPNQDKNKIFLTQPLGKISTLDNLPHYSFDNIVNRSSTIDVIWFNKNQMPHSFYEIEHTTDIQNSLLKFNDLQDFHVRMVIVADEKRRNEFVSKLNYAAFEKLRKDKRVAFLSYDSLNMQYQQEVQKQKFDFIV